MTDTEKNLKHSTPAAPTDFLARIEQAAQSKGFRRVSAKESALRHPAREKLYEYAQGGLDADERTAIRKHLAACAACAREALIILRVEAELKPQAVDWFSHVKDQVTSFSAQLLSSVSEFWQPPLAGAMVTAADISEQTHSFQVPEGDIDLVCSWRAQYGTTPAHIHLEWSANLVAARELWAFFFDPVSKEPLVEILLKNSFEGHKDINSEDLGFDPSEEPWGISILLKRESP